MNIKFLKNLHIDFRVQFIFLNIVIPLLITLIGLLLFKSATVVFWYFMCLLGITCVIIGVVGFALPQNNFSVFSTGVTIGKAHFSPQLIFTVVGGIIVVLCFLSFIISIIITVIRNRRKVQTEQEDSSENAFQAIYRDEDYQKLADLHRQDHKPVSTVAEQKAEDTQFSWLRLLRAAATIIVCTFMGIWLTGALQLRFFKVNSSNSFDRLISFSRYTIVFKIIGSTLLLYAILNILYMIPLTFKKGRYYVHLTMRLVRRNALRMIFFILTIMYSPITQNIFSAFVCTDYKCAAGTQFPQEWSSLNLASFQSISVNTSMTNVTLPCMICDFHPTNNCSIVDELCPGSTSLRFFKDPTLNCRKEIMPFLWPASLLLGLIYVLGVPILFLVLTRKSIVDLQNMEVEHMLKKNQPPPPPSENKYEDGGGGDAEELKSQKVTMQQTSMFDVIEKPMAMSHDELPVMLGNEYYAFNKFNPEEEKVAKAPSEKLKATIKAVIVTRKRFASKEERKMYYGEKIERWNIRTALTINPIRSIYYCYEYQWRYFKIYSMAIRLLLVCVMIVLQTFPQASLPITLAIHIVTTVSMCVSRPYQFIGEDILAITGNFLSALTVVFAIVALYVKNMPLWTFYTITAINGILPVMLIVLIIVSIISRFWSSKKYQTLQQALEQNEEFTDKNRVNWPSLKKNHEEIDEELTLTSLKYVVNFFMLLGIFAFVCLAVTGIGLLYGDLNPIVVPPISLTFTGHSSCKNALSNDFVGYSSWEEFTDNCCCKETHKYEYTLSPFMSNYREVELWQCRNKRMKERVRMVYESGRNITGYHFRPFCGTQFSTNYTLATCYSPFYATVPSYYNVMFNDTFSELPTTGDERIEMLNLW
jgi:hypothetical protein